MAKSISTLAAIAMAARSILTPAFAAEPSRTFPAEFNPENILACFKKIEMGSHDEYVFEDTATLDNLRCSRSSDGKWCSVSTLDTLATDRPVAMYNWHSKKALMVINNNAGRAVIYHKNENASDVLSVMTNGNRNNFMNAGSMSMGDIVDGISSELLAQPERTLIKTLLDTNPCQTLIY